MKQTFSTITAALGLIGLIAFGSFASADQNSNSRNTQDSTAAIYQKRCASCHGRDGRAKTLKAKFNDARDLTNWQWQEAVSDEQLYNSIMNGRGKMPAFSKKLSEAQVDALVLYVRSLKKG